MDILILIIGVVALNLIHIISSLGDLRGALLTRLGRRTYFSIYGIISTIGFALIVWGYYERNFTPVYTPPEWGYVFNIGLMYVTLFMLASQFFKGFIKFHTRLPLILSVIFWAFGHLTANGDLHSIILFGGFLTYGLISILFKYNAAKPSFKPHYKFDLVALLLGYILYAILSIMHAYFAGVELVL